MQFYNNLSPLIKRILFIALAYLLIVQIQGVNQWWMEESMSNMNVLGYADANIQKNIEQDKVENNKMPMIYKPGTVQPELDDYNSIQIMQAFMMPVPPEPIIMPAVQQTPPEPIDGIHEVAKRMRINGFIAGGVVISGKYYEKGDKLTAFRYQGKDNQVVVPILVNVSHNGIQVKGYKDVENVVAILKN